MKNLFFLSQVFILLFVSFTIRANKNAITIDPRNCPSCLAALELTKGDTNIFVFPSSFSYDSTILRKKYKFINEAKMIFSDSLYSAYSVDGFPSISNLSGTMKSEMRYFYQKEYDYFKQWTSQKTIDTIEYSYPLNRDGITQTIYDNNKAYLLNSIGNEIIVFDLLRDTVLKKIELNESIHNNSYSQYFGTNDSIYYHYKAVLEPNINEDLNSIVMMSLDNDTLYCLISNTFYFLNVERPGDTFLTNFQSIAKFYDGNFIENIIPTKYSNNNELNLSRLNVVAKDIYAHKNSLFLSVKVYHHDIEKPQWALAKYNKITSQLTPFASLPKEYKAKTYDFSNGYFSKNYFVFQKSTRLYDIETQKDFELKYFTQEYRNNFGLSDFPRFVNFDISVLDGIIRILYFDNIKNEYSIAVISTKDNNIINNKVIGSININFPAKLDTFNSNYIIQKLGSNKFIRTKVF